VKPSVSSVIQQIPNPNGVPVPVIAERTASTQVDIRNGELLVIGGLFEHRVRKDSTKIPVVGYIPLLGKLFSSIDDAEDKTEIIFILKLRILTAIERAEARLRAIPGEPGFESEGK
jgi:general secretion pathway protein D